VVKISSLKRVLQQWTTSLRDDSEGFRTSGEEVAADRVETAREPGSEVEPEDGADLLQSRDQI